VGCWLTRQVVKVLEEDQTGIANIAVNEKNRTHLIDVDVIPFLFDVITKGGPMDKECSANALWVLAKAQTGKKKIRDHTGAMATLNELSKNSNRGIAAAADRVLLMIKPQPMQQGTIVDKSSLFG
jgi:hypothetical protein